MTKNIKIALYIVIVCLLLPVKVYAQQTTVVTGIVTDSLTHEPLSYVSVFLKGTQVGGMTVNILCVRQATAQRLYFRLWDM